MKSSKDIKIDYNVKGLKKLQQALNNEYYVKLGIFGNKSSRSSKVTNASIGLVHEFGSITKNIPARSFLRMPLVEKSKEFMNFIKKQSDFIMNSLSKGELIGLLEKIGVKAEAIVQEAFESSGYGKWQPLKYREGTPLIDTGELRGSVTSKVEKNG